MSQKLHSVNNTLIANLIIINYIIIYVRQSQVEIEDYSVKVKIEVNAVNHSSTALSTQFLIGSALARLRDELQASKHRPFGHSCQLIFAPLAKIG